MENDSRSCDNYNMTEAKKAAHSQNAALHERRNDPIAEVPTIDPLYEYREIHKKRYRERIDEETKRVVLKCVEEQQEADREIADELELYERRMQDNRLAGEREYQRQLGQQHREENDTLPTARNTTAQPEPPLPSDDNLPLPMRSNYTEQLLPDASPYFSDHFDMEASLLPPANDTPGTRTGYFRRRFRSWNSLCLIPIFLLIFVSALTLTVLLNVLH